MALVVAPEPKGTADGRRLIAALDAELDARYADVDPAELPGPHEDQVTDEQITAPNGTFLVARLDGVAVGCAALRRYDGETGEVKRMYVDPAARGQGVARAMLEQLQVAAAALGYRRLVLETGTRQPEAVALYESAGWRPIANYGPYDAVPWSRCYELVLPSPPSA